MFGVSFLEIALVGLVALLVVGPQKLPAMMRTAGEWVGKIRRMTADMRAQTGIDDILREEGIDGVAELRTLLKGERALAARRGAAPSYRPYEAYTADPDPALEFPTEGPDAAGALPDDLIEDASSSASPSEEQELQPANAEASTEPTAETPPPLAPSTRAEEAPAEVAPLAEAPPSEAQPSEAPPAEAPPAAALPAEAPPSVRPPPPSASRPPAPSGSRPPAPARSRPPLPAPAPLPAPRPSATSAATTASGTKSEPPRPPRSVPPTIAEKPDSFPPPPVTPRLSPPRATTLRETPQSKAPVAPVETFGAPTKEPPPSSRRPALSASPERPASDKGDPT